MKILKQSLFLFLSIFCFSAFHAANAEKLSDIKNHPNMQAIEYLFEHDIISGYPDGSFQPDKTINRAELLKILVGGKSANPALEEYSNCFPDVKDQWFAPYVCYAKEEGWVSGYPDGTFRPSKTVNTVEAIKMVSLSQNYVPLKKANLTSYGDVDPSKWYAEYVFIADERNLLDQESTLGVANDMMRAQVSEMIFRAIQYNLLLESEDIVDSEEETSLDLIQTEYENREIDYDTYIKYSVFALYSDDIPSKYESKNSLFDDVEILFELSKNFDDLSEDVQEDLAPYLKRPDDPESSFNQNTGEIVASKETIASTVYVARPDAENLYTDYLTSTNGKVKIWYPSRDIEVKESGGTNIIIFDTVMGFEMAQKIKNMIDNDGIIERYIELLDREYVSDGERGGDEMLDIYITKIGALGLATMDLPSHPSSGYIQINAGLAARDDKYLRATVAHEIFHVFQYSYSYSHDKNVWWMEATATWAMDFIYPLDNVEQVFVKKFIPYPEVTLYKKSPPGLHHYAAYLFPFYLTHFYADDIIRDIWEQCESEECYQAIDTIVDGGYKEHWGRFTLWNFNKNPAKKFMDPSGYFSGISSYGKADVEAIQFTSATEEKEIETKTLKPLTHQLIRVKNDVGIGTTDVKKLVFTDLRNIFEKSDKATIYAVIYYNNEKPPIVEEWTEKDQRSFCIDVEKEDNEDFSEVILIISNGEKDLELESTFLAVEARNSCGGDWSGTLTITGKFTDTYNCPWEDYGQKSSSWKITVNEELDENILPDALGNNNIAYEIIEQRVEYTLTESSKDVEVFSSGETATKKRTQGGYGSVTRYPDMIQTVETELGTITMGRKPRFKYFDKLPEMILNAAGESDMPSNKYVLFLDILGGNIHGTMYGMCDFVTYAISSSTTYSNSDGHSDQWTEENECNESMITNFNEEELNKAMMDIDPPTEDGKRITGSISLISNQNTEPDWSEYPDCNDVWSNDVTVEWDYKKN